VFNGTLVKLIKFPAEHLTIFHGTLVFRGTPVKNHWSSGLGLEPDEVGQTGLKLLHLWCHSQKTQNQKIFFSLQTWRLAESFEGLNSSLVLLALELSSHKDTSKLLDFRLKPPGSYGVN